MWIKRDITSIIESNQDPIQIIRGPRQCGKTSLLLHIDQGFEEVSLDDPALRELAQTDPELFLNQYKNKKLFIDEAQHAPNIFPSLKRRVDLYKREQKKIQTIFRLTGSNQILMDRHVKESLSGRASYFDMNTLSVAEVLNSKDMPIQEILFRGGWPELYTNESLNPHKYLDDYINSYIEKDIVLSAGIHKSREFLRFVRLLAGRVGEILDYAHFANELGIDAKTIKEWVSVLEKMHVIVLVMPYSSNLSTRLIKSPKVYFIDTGLACRLQGWNSSSPILTSPQQGHLFENLVFSEIYKFNLNYQKSWQIFHWRSKDKEEVDFLIQLEPGNFIFIEAKVSAKKLPNISSFPEIKRVFKNKVPRLIQCHQEGGSILGDNVPITYLKQYLQS